jgi:hypothetical protein
MANTFMTGPLEGAIFQRMSYLHYLELSENAFNSTIPKTLAKLVKLSSRYAYNSGFSRRDERLFTAQEQHFGNVVRRQL